MNKNKTITFSIYIGKPSVLRTTNENIILIVLYKCISTYVYVNILLVESHSLYCRCYYCHYFIDDEIEI